MFIVKGVLDLNKLRQERHGGARCKPFRSRAFNSNHAASTELGRTTGVLVAINMALLSELSPHAGILAHRRKQRSIQATPALGHFV